jgi:hypothetical protein
MDVLAREDLPFPRSLPEFQRIFPDDAACAAYLESARWKEGFNGIHHGASAKHLQAYLNEFTFRFNVRLRHRPQGEVRLAYAARAEAA